MRGSEGLFDDSKHMESKPDHSGVELIVWTLVNMMLRTVALRHAVASGMNVLMTLQEKCFHNGIPLCSLCSGSDLFLHALYKTFSFLSSCWLDQSRNPLQFEHVWSCESDSVKQRWLLDVMQVPLLFTDVTDLGARGERALCLRAFGCEELRRPSPALRVVDGRISLQIRVRVQPQAQRVQ